MVVVVEIQDKLERGLDHGLAGKKGRVSSSEYSSELCRVGKKELSTRQKLGRQFFIAVE